ncbi:MAG: hypothetical protein AB7G62_18425 [Magnetospirillum sp.]
MRRLALMLPLLALAMPAHAAQLDVTIAGIDGSAPIRVLLLDNRPKEDMQDHVRSAQTATVAGHVAHTRFLGLPPGEYQVMAYRTGSDAVAESHVRVGHENTKLELTLGQ